MKLFPLLSILLLLACNDNVETTSVTTTDTTTTTDTAATKVEPLTPITKTPEVSTTEDMLNPSVIDNKAWELKKKNGIAWLGIGTEPFWSVERKKDSLIFNMSEWNKPVIVKATRSINSKDSVVYVAEAPSQKLRTIIIPGQCSDGMSDRKYEYSVKVIYNGETYKGCAVIFNP
jgi:uncharacterized membrane protein